MKVNGKEVWCKHSGFPGHMRARELFDEGIDPCPMWSQGGTCEGCDFLHLSFKPEKKEGEKGRNKFLY